MWVKSRELPEGGRSQVKYMNGLNCGEVKKKPRIGLCIPPCPREHSPSHLLTQKSPRKAPTTYPRPPDRDREAEKVRTGVMVTFMPHHRALILGAICGPTHPLKWGRCAEARKAQSGRYLMAQKPEPSPRERGTEEIT